MVSCAAPFGPVRPFTALSSSLLHADVSEARRIMTANEPMVDRWLFIIVLRRRPRGRSAELLSTHLMKSLLIACDRFIDYARRNFTLLPTDDLHPLSLEVLVDMEE